MTTYYFKNVIDNNWSTLGNWWTATNGGGSPGLVPAGANSGTLDGASGATCTVDADISCAALVLDTYTGTFDNSGNHAVSLSSQFSCSGAAVKTVTMGAAPWTITGSNAAPWVCTTAANLTLNGSSSTLTFNQTSNGSTINFGTPGFGTGYGTVILEGTSSSTVWTQYTIATAGTTIPTFTITGPVWVLLNSSVTLTITNPFTWTGGTKGIILEGNSSSTSKISVGSGTSKITNAAIAKVQFIGGGTFTATGYDIGDNGGITISPPGGAPPFIGG